MLKYFFRRIIAEAILELISPQLNDIRAAIEEVDAKLHDEITELCDAMERSNASFHHERQSFNSKLKEDIRIIKRRLDDLF